MSNLVAGAQSAHTAPDGRPSSAMSRKFKLQRGGKRDGPQGQASWASCVINLVNTLVGAGVLAMPLAFSHMGMFLGILIVIWAGVTAGFGLYLQTRCARYLDHGSASFFALSQITYPNTAVIFDAAIAIKCFGVAVSYLIIIGDLMPGILLGLNGDTAGNVVLMDRRFWVTVFMLVVIPFSFLRRLDSLRYTSFIALVSVGYLVVLVVAHCIIRDTWSQRGPVRYFTWQSPIATLSSLPVMVFAYTCHQNMFSVLNEIKDPSPSKTTSVVTTSIGTAGFVYILVAVTGYLSYGDQVAGNIVAMYPPSAFSTIGKAAIVILVMFSYALQVHPCRASVDAVLKWRPARRDRGGADDSPSRRAPLLSQRTAQPLSASKAEPMSENRFAVITTAIIILSYIVAITVSSLEKVLSYVGSTGSTAISFILPGLMFYKISSPDSPHQQRLSKTDDDEDNMDEGDAGGSTADAESGSSGSSRFLYRWRSLPVLRRLSLALAVYGMVTMVVCLITNTFFIVAH